MRSEKIKPLQDLCRSIRTRGDLDDQITTLAAICKELGLDSRVCLRDTSHGVGAYLKVREAEDQPWEILDPGGVT